MCHFQEGKRDQANIIYFTSLPVIFGVKKYADALWEVSAVMKAADGHSLSDYRFVLTGLSCDSFLFYLFEEIDGHCMKVGIIKIFFFKYMRNPVEYKKCLLDGEINIWPVARN